MIWGYIVRLFKKLFVRVKEQKPLPVTDPSPVLPKKQDKTYEQKQHENYYGKKRHLRKIRNKIARMSRRKNRRKK